MLTYTTSETEATPFSLDNSMLDMAVGYKEKIPFRFSEDMNFFRRLTENGIVIYGRKTLGSFPNGNPLPNRENWVLTSQKIEIPGALVFHRVNEILDSLAKFKTTSNVWVIGGASVYEQLLPYCSIIYRTVVFNDKNPQPADAFFKIPDSFVLTDAEADRTVHCRFAVYENSNVRSLRKGAEHEP